MRTSTKVVIWVATAVAIFALWVVFMPTSLNPVAQWHVARDMETNAGLAPMPPPGGWSLRVTEDGGIITRSVIRLEFHAPRDAIMRWARESPGLGEPAARSLEQSGTYSGGIGSSSPSMYGSIRIDATEGTVQIEASYD
jgi:hypothetical protein